jgi:hypothetical protein
LHLIAIIKSKTLEIILNIDKVDELIIKDADKIAESFDNFLEPIHLMMNVFFT